MTDGRWMDHDEDYTPSKPAQRKKQQPVPRAAKPDNIDARLAAIQQRVIVAFRDGRR